MDRITFGGAHKPSSSFYMHEGEQVARYVFCQQYVRDKDVLDLGCGYGYGIDFLATDAKSAIGADTDQKAISFAQRTYTRQNLRFALMDKSRKFEDASFDVIVLLEVIEHVTNPKLLVSETLRILRNGGQLILSTPNRLFTEQSYKDGKSPNPYHLHEFYPSELQHLLKQYFNGIVEFAQIWPDSSEVEIHEELISACKIPKRIRAIIPNQIKNMYLKTRGLPPISNRLGKWRDYPVVQTNPIDKTFPVQLYCCTKK